LRPLTPISTIQLNHSAQIRALALRSRSKIE